MKHRNGRRMHADRLKTAGINGVQIVNLVIPFGGAILHRLSVYI